MEDSHDTCLWGSWEGASFAGGTSHRAPHTARTPLTTRHALGGRAAPNWEGFSGLHAALVGTAALRQAYLGVVRALKGREPAEHTREKVRHVGCDFNTQEDFVMEQRRFIGEGGHEASRLEGETVDHTR